MIYDYLFTLINFCKLRLKQYDLLGVQVGILPQEKRRSPVRSKSRKIQKYDPLQKHYLDIPLQQQSPDRSLYAVEEESHDITKEQECQTEYPKVKIKTPKKISPLRKISPAASVSERNRGAELRIQRDQLRSRNAHTEYQTTRSSQQSRMTPRVQISITRDNQLISTQKKVRYKVPESQSFVEQK